MLHTKFRENRPASSGEDFLRVFTIYGCGGHLGHVTHMPRTNFCFPYPKIGKAVLKKKMFEIVYDGRTTKTTAGCRTMSILEAHL